MVTLDVTGAAGRRGGRRQPPAGASHAGGLCHVQHGAHAGPRRLLLQPAGERRSVGSVRDTRRSNGAEVQLRFVTEMCGAAVSHHPNKRFTEYMLKYRSNKLRSNGLFEPLKFGGGISSYIYQRASGTSSARTKGLPYTW